LRGEVVEHGGMVHDSSGIEGDASVASDG